LPEHLSNYVLCHYHPAALLSCGDAASDPLCILWFDFRGTSSSAPRRSSLDFGSKETSDVHRTHYRNGSFVAPNSEIAERSSADLVIAFTEMPKEPV
jgi:hypothetical protein